MGLLVTEAAPEPPCAMACMLGWQSSLAHQHAGAFQVCADAGTLPSGSDGQAARRGRGLPLMEAVAKHGTLARRVTAAQPLMQSFGLEQCCAGAGELAQLQAVVAGLARGAGMGLPIMEAAAEAEANLAALAQRRPP